MGRLVATLAIVACVCTSNAIADFDGAYAPANWSFYTDSTGTGTLDALQMYVLGIDSGRPGYTEYYITVGETATVTFDWEFLTSDPTGNEFAFYAVNLSETTFANADGQSGTIALNLSVGDILELGVHTTNGTNGPGELTISNFVFPEPSSLALLAAGALFWRRR